MRSPRRRLLRGVLLAGSLLLLGACASAPAPRGADPAARRSAGGAVHIVARGENLYRIGRRYGVSVDAIRRANHVTDVTALRIGQRLVIPAATSQGRRAPSARDSAAAREAAREALRRAPGHGFRWPVRGRLTSRYGRRRGGPHEGIDIAAPRGTRIVAAESGKVIFAGRMGDYGKMLVVKHAGSLRSVYAHVARFHVSRGAFVEKGQHIADVGTTGNASGPHLHFEIREHDHPRDPMRYLP